VTDGVKFTRVCGRDGWPLKNMADQFHRHHLERNAVACSTVVKLFIKFKETCFVADKQLSGSPNISETVPETAMAELPAGHINSLRRTSLELQIPRSTMHDILQKNFQPYKLQVLHHHRT
jgi:hypothetical protein